MLHEKPVQYNLPDGTGIGADAGSEDWTVTKRPRHLDHTEVRTSSSDSHPAQGGQEDAFFTMADLEEVFMSFEESLEIMRSNKKKPFVFVNKSRILDDQSQRLVYQRLVLYRLKAHKLSKGESIDNLEDETLEKKLPNFLRKETESISRLHSDVENYYKILEAKEGGSLGWYFDPEFSKIEELADYQRLVLKNHHDDVEYLNWKGYRLDFSTYKMDKEYVKFCTEMSKKLQWQKKYIKSKGKREWLETEIRGRQHALKIATRYPRVIDDLVLIAYGEHIWSLHNDYLYRDEWDITFLEIWKLVTRKQLDFTTALMQVKEKKYVPQHDSSLKYFLINSIASGLESRFDFCVEGIPHDAEDGVAKERITRKILKLPRKNTLHRYKLKKMAIAEEIGLHKHEDPIRPPLFKYSRDEYADFIRVNEAGDPIEADPGSTSSLPSKCA